ncbi:MAG: KamA family radical SAM protein [Thermodesulfobacteriota bacterium]
MKKELLSADDFEPPSTNTALGAMPAYTQLDLIPKSKPKVVQIQKVPSIPRFRVGARTSAFRKRVFPHVNPVEWNDWQWQLRYRFTEVKALEQIIHLSPDERAALTNPSRRFPMAITPYYASLLDRDNPVQAIRRAVVPVMAEHAISRAEKEDPLGEDHDSPVPGLVHRYPDRVLFLVTDFCSTYCRYCTRSRMVGHGGSHSPMARWEEAIRYIEATPSVRDVLLSGGDPLTLPDESLDWLLSRLRRIPHVELLRIGTKAPVVLPQRVTPVLVRMLKHHHPLWMSIHFSHPDELTPETAQACERLADAGIPLGSQTVLLAGINDDVTTMKRLMHGLLRIRVKPYYLYQCDPICGSSHFRTPVAKGLEIIRGLRGHTTGYAVPNYVIDAPGGGGKIPLLPEYLVGRDGADLLLRNYEEKIYRYPDPEGDLGDPQIPTGQVAIG